MKKRKQDCFQLFLIGFTTVQDMNDEWLSSLTLDGNICWKSEADGLHDRHKNSMVWLGLLEMSMCRLYTEQSDLFSILECLETFLEVFSHSLF